MDEYALGGTSARASARERSATDGLRRTEQGKMSGNCVSSPRPEAAVTANRQFVIERASRYSPAQRARRAASLPQTCS